MELIMLLFALFVFFFGSVLAMQVFEFGLSVSDKLLISVGKIMKLLFTGVFNLIWFLGKYIFKKLKKHDPEYQIRPIIITPVELQHLRNQQISHKNRHQPVLIDYPAQKNQKVRVRAK